MESFISNATNLFSNNNKVGDNFDSVRLKEIYYKDLSGLDQVKSLLGLDITDYDKDSLPDSVEEKKGTDRLNPDTDYDGLPDGYEVYRGINPLKIDTDEDGVIDGRDMFPFDRYKTYSDLDIDSDGDKVGDKVENELKSNPFNYDTDNDGLPDGIDSSINGGGNSFVRLSEVPAIASKELSLSINNPIISFASNIVFIFTIFFLILLVIVFLKYWDLLKKNIDHYYHMFAESGAIGWKDEYYDLGHHGHGDHDSHTNHAGHSDHPVNESQHSQATHDSKEILVDHVQNEFTEKWNIVLKYISEENELMSRMAIVESDILLDKVLRDRGYFGQDLGEMLKNLNIEHVNDAWEAHKIRNRIAHEGMSYHVPQREARRVISMYESVFRELGVL